MIYIDCEECVWSTQEVCLPRLATRYQFDVDVDSGIFYLECRVCGNDIPTEMTEEMLIDYESELQ